MPKISKTVVDKKLREEVFGDIFADPSDTGYIPINDRQWGIILTDANGTERYCRIGVIVAEEREDMTARELMQKEIDEYQAKQEKKANHIVNWIFGILIALGVLYMIATVLMQA